MTKLEVQAEIDRLNTETEELRKAVYESKDLTNKEKIHYLSNIRNEGYGYIYRGFFDVDESDKIETKITVGELKKMIYIPTKPNRYRSKFELKERLDFERYEDVTAERIMDYVYDLQIDDAYNDEHNLTEMLLYEASWLELTDEDLNNDASEIVCTVVPLSRIEQNALTFAKDYSHFNFDW